MGVLEFHVDEVPWQTLPSGWQIGVAKCTDGNWHGFSRSPDDPKHRIAVAPGCWASEAEAWEQVRLLWLKVEEAAKTKE